MSRRNGISCPVGLWRFAGTHAVLGRLCLGRAFSDWMNSIPNHPLISVSASSRGDHLRAGEVICTVVLCPLSLSSGCDSPSSCGGGGGGGKGKETLGFTSTEASGGGAGKWKLYIDWKSEDDARVVPRRRVVHLTIDCSSVSQPEGPTSCRPAWTVSNGVSDSPSG